MERYMGPVNFIEPEKILHFPEEIDTLKRGGIPNVLNVEVDLSERCNANCRECDFPDHRNEDMEPDTLRLTLALLEDWGTRAVVLTGGGEPTIHKDFLAISHLLRTYHKLGLYTNGIQPINPEPFSWIYVSLDAATEEEWGNYKRVNPHLFNHVLGNIRQYSKAATCGVGFLIGEDNYTRLQEMRTVAFANGGTYCHFRPRYPITPGNWESDCYKYLEAEAKTYGVQVAWDKFHDAFHWERKYRVCWASMFLRQIDAAGNVWVCPTTRWLRKLGHVSESQQLLRPVMVTDQCRPLCRGHAMNKVLDRIMTDTPHQDFV